MTAKAIDTKSFEARRASGIKEQVLGLEVFDRGQDFNPRLDPIVRVQARLV